MISRNARRTPVCSRHKITLNGHSVSYAVKISQIARHARLEVRPETGLTVVVPRWYDLERVQRLLEEKRRWILEYLAKYGHGRNDSAKKRLKSGDTIPYLGRGIQIVAGDPYASPESVTFERERLIVNLSDGETRLPLAVEAWYRVQAASLIQDKVDKFTTRLGVRCNRLSIRAQKTRWGSCSKKGNLSFNWRLLMAPEPVVDYVIIHELAHLKEMNHSQSFWLIVARHCPGWREHRKWLREHAGELASMVPA